MINKNYQVNKFLRQNYTFGMCLYCYYISTKKEKTWNKQKILSYWKRRLFIQLSFLLNSKSHLLLNGPYWDPDANKSIILKALAEGKVWNQDDVLWDSQLPDQSHRSKLPPNSFSTVATKLLWSWSRKSDPDHNLVFIHFKVPDCPNNLPPPNDKMIITENCERWQWRRWGDRHLWSLRTKHERATLHF